MGRHDETVTVYKDSNVMIKHHHIEGYFCYIKQDDSWIKCSLPSITNIPLSTAGLAFLAPILNRVFERGYNYGRSKLYRETMKDVVVEAKNAINAALDKYI